MAKNKTEIHVTTVFDGELDATDVFVSLISQKYGKTNTKEYLANNLNLAMVTIYTFLLFFCCFGCHRGENPGNKGFSPATGSATGWQQGVQRAVIFRMERQIRKNNLLKRKI